MKRDFSFLEITNLDFGLILATVVFGIIVIAIELETNDSVDDINWECFEYVNIKSKAGLRKKLMLVKKKTKLGHMIQYFQNLLNAFFRIKNVLI
jgi:hypothetical protein